MRVLLLLLIGFNAHAQTLSWPVPDGAGEKFNVKGYKLSYEIMDGDECTDIDSDLRYHVDVGNVNSWPLRKDKNFQEGMTYLLRVSTYTETSESVESDISACIKIKRPNSTNPQVDKEVYLDLKQNDKQQTTEVAKNEKSIINGGLFNAAHADEPSRKRDVPLEPKASEYGERDDRHSGVQAYFSGRSGSGRDESVSREDSRPGAINATVSEPRHRRGIVHGEPDKQRVGRGANIQLSNGVVPSGNGRDKGVLKSIELSVVDDQNLKPGPANEPNSNRLALWIVGVLAVLGGIIYWLRGIK